MSWPILYLLLLKATLTSFSGLSSIAVVRDDLVVRRHVLTDRQLNNAVAMARLSPGPNGLYLVCVGQIAGGIPGAMAGAAAMMTPAFLIVPILARFGRRAENPAVKRCIRAVILAAAGLVLASTIPLARDAIVGPATAGIAIATCAALVLTRIDTAWVIALAALCGLVLRYTT